MFNTATRLLSPLAQFVESATSFDPSDTLLPFTVEGVLAGWMKRGFAERLADWPEYFSVRPRGVGMLGEFASAEHRSAAIAEVIESLAMQEVIRGWRGESVTVAESFHSAPLFHVERASSRYFGFTMYASHVNGLTARNGQPYMWIARRADSKNIDPGKLDNLAAGRISRGHLPLQTMIKECFEEAGIPQELAKTGRGAGAIRCKYAVDEGFHNEIVFTHDLILPESFTPHNQDGEVAEFICLPITEVLALIETPHQFTVDACIVIIDCLLRRGYISSEREDYIDLVHAMRP